MSPAPDAFEQAYSAPLLDEDPAPPPRAAPGPPGGPPIAGVAPALPFALRGTVLTPDRRINDGYVEIAGSTIVRVGTAKPAAGYADDRDRWRHPARPPRPPRPPGVQRLRRLGAPEALRQPHPLARLGRVPPRGQGAAGPAEGGSQPGAHAHPLRRGTRARRRDDRDPGHEREVRHDRGGARPQRGPADLRGPPGALDHRPRPDPAGRPGPAARADRRRGGRRRSTSTSPRAWTRARTTSSPR